MDDNYAVEIPIWPYYTDEHIEYMINQAKTKLMRQLVGELDSDTWLAIRIREEWPDPGEMEWYRMYEQVGGVPAYTPNIRLIADVSKIVSRHAPSIPEYYISVPEKQFSWWSSADLANELKLRAEKWVKGKLKWMNKSRQTK